MTPRFNWASLLLSATLLSGVAALLWQPPFAFSSPDVSYHASRILRSSEGDYFRDPFSGTSTIYPGLFHFIWGLAQRFTGWNALQVVRLAGALNVLGTFLGFYLLARATLRDSRRASLGTLALGLVLLAPSGRSLLLANPVNSSLGLLFAGLALVWRFLEDGRLRDWTLGLALTSFAVNVSWYQGLAAAGAVTAVSACLWREQRLNRQLLWRGAVAVAGPCLWTAAHLFAIRDVLPSYLANHDGLVTWTLDREILRDWALTYATHWNLKFLPQTWRSLPATILWLGAILPSTALLLSLPFVAAIRGRGRPPTLKPRSWTLFQSAALIFLFSLAMTMTRDLGRVAWIQFVSFGFLLLFGVEIMADVCAPRLASRLFASLGLSGAACLAYTVLHRPMAPDVYAVTRPTRAVIDLIAAQPEHRNLRIFVTEANLRRLTPFVTFLGLVNHLSGRYYSQDPKSSDEMLLAYQSILSRDSTYRESLDRYDVRLLILRHLDSADEDRLAAAYAADADVILRNREWVVLRRRSAGL